MRTVLAVAIVLGLHAGLAATARAETGDVVVGGVWVCRLAKGAGGLTLAQRVAQTEQRIADVLSIPEHRRPQITVEVRPAGGAAVIVAAEITIVVVTPEDASGTGVGPPELANQWARRLAEGLRRALPGRDVVTQVHVLPMRTGAGEAAALVGTTWYWQYTQMNDGSGVAPGDRRNYSVRFAEDGAVEVRANCTSGGGTYVRRGPVMTVSLAALGRPACSPAGPERLFLANLRDVVSYALSGGVLLLGLKGNAGTMRFSQDAR
jgi:heat shock protein HslJ